MPPKKPNANKDDRVLTVAEARKFSEAIEREELNELRLFSEVAQEHLLALLVENEELRERIDYLERELDKASSD